ncbi:MAG: hypothetical protein E7428_00310 [Ruminococcaceae bacterium]|nr:hypothetical protein [Oscillospiraceae bacterium]
MIKIIDTFDQVQSLLSGASFDLDTWKSYVNSIYSNSAKLFLDDMQELLSCGYTFEKDFLPVILAVRNHPKLSELHQSFRAVTNRLNERVLDAFGKELDIEIVLYLGLCNGAGWVTTVNDKNVILLGMEKILELDWQDEDNMRGLIYHELGHAYHMQHGTFHQPADDSIGHFLWQLFTEGIAMTFEQILVGSPDYYHQDKDGWKDWCDAHLVKIVTDFQSDLPTMTRTSQRYFGDWVRYQEHGDVGYYLGARFIHFLLGQYTFAQLIHFPISDIQRFFTEFCESFS